MLEEIGVPAPSLRTVFRALARCVERDYRDTLAKACLAHSVSTTAGQASLVFYDCTTLYFETENEDKLRRVGMSKERRVDPQIQVGLLVDPAGFPLEVHCFEGNKAETKTLIPVLTAFRDRHGVTDMVVVADAGMLSAGNLNALADAGFKFIVGSRISKAPLRPGRALRTARGLLHRRPDPRIQPHHGCGQAGSDQTGRLLLLVQAAQV